jgi:hypothetical protein
MDRALGPNAKDLSLADLMQLSGKGILQITASADGTRWRRRASVINPSIH